MKRVGHLTEQIASIDNLYLAFIKACRGKQCKKEVKAFRRNFDSNISQIQHEIMSGCVDVGHYHYFTIHDPKERLICAAPFKERVLHHALMNICHKYFDRSLIDETFATRPGKGQYKAIDMAVDAFKQYEYVAKIDMRKYFDSISHQILKQQLRNKFKDARLLEVFFQIIDSYHTTDGNGLPIGNLTSQYFANMYLSGLDHYAKEHLHIPIYIRYMDDILIFAHTKPTLKRMIQQIDIYVNNLQLKMKPPVVRSAHEGIPFLGYRIMPFYYTLHGRSKRRFRTKLQQYDKLLANGMWSESNYSEHILPLIAFTKHAICWNFRYSCIQHNLLET